MPLLSNISIDSCTRRQPCHAIRKPRLLDPTSVQFSTLWFRTREIGNSYGGRATLQADSTYIGGPDGAGTGASSIPDVGDDMGGGQGEGAFLTTDRSRSVQALTA